MAQASDFMVSLLISIIGISVMSWWLYTRVSQKLTEVEERNNGAEAKWNRFAYSLMAAVHRSESEFRRSQYGTQELLIDLSENSQVNQII